MLLSRQRELGDLAYLIRRALAGHLGSVRALCNHPAATHQLPPAHSSFQTAAFQSSPTAVIRPLASDVSDSHPSVAQGSRGLGPCHTMPHHCIAHGAHKAVQPKREWVEAGGQDIAIQQCSTMLSMALTVISSSGGNSAIPAITCLTPTSEQVLFPALHCQPAYGKAGLFSELNCISTVFGEELFKQQIGRYAAIVHHRSMFESEQARQIMS